MNNPFRLTTLRSVGFAIRLLLLAALFAACTNDDTDTSRPDYPLTMRLVGGLKAFDDSTATRAAAWTWQDGATVYLQLKNGNSTVSCKALYDKGTDTWAVDGLNGASLATSGQCEIYYFDGAATSPQTTTVALSYIAGIYADRSGSYAYSDGVVTVSAILSPLTSRLRFALPSGTAVNNVCVKGISYYATYNTATNTFTTTDEAIIASVNTSTGYTSYIYGTFVDATNRQLTLTNSTDGSYVTFTRSFTATIFQTGKSGTLTIPTKADSKNWTMKDDTPELTVPDDVEAVDLGLPSGLLWANMNVGASKPEDYGAYFTWGETNLNSEYNWVTYKYCDGNPWTITKYCTSSEYGTVDNKTELEADDDAAAAKWGGKWRMPTYNEIMELLDNTTSKWTTVNGVNGGRFTSNKANSNGTYNSIFIPAAGWRYQAGLGDEGSYCGVWSSSVAPSSCNARYLYFGSSGASLAEYNRCFGQSVRPVQEPDTEPSQTTERTFTVTGNGKTVTFKMIRVEGGTFMMGATDEQGSDAYDNEKPAHSVTISKDYYMGETEVTQALWYAVMGQKPTSDGSQWSSSYGLGDSRPAYHISWNDCTQFFTTLNQKLADQLGSGEQFRFPTEAEWEFAARGGNKSKGYKYAGSNTIGDVAWYTVNSSDKGSSSSDYGTHDVGTKAPNELGLYDMSGNVWEWCQDWYNSSYYSSSPTTDPTGPTTGSYRVDRGGGWGGDAGGCRVSNRNCWHADGRLSDLGLRLALQ